jgi:anti-sigma regulatory factor (Ser/Thr protein kinase)
MFHFSVAGFQRNDFLSICRNGLPSMSYYGSLVVRTAFFNMLIITKLDGDMLAVMLVVSSFFTVIDAATGGAGDATLLLGGVLYGQRDIKGQRKLLRTALTAAAILFLVISVLTIAFAMPIAGLFSNSCNPAFIAQAAHAICLTALCFVPNALACVLKKFIQSVGRSVYTSVTNVLCNVVYVCIAAWILVRLAGSDGLFLSFTVCYGLILITHIVYAYRISQSSGRSGFDRLLFLPAHYEVSDANQWVYSIRDINGCVKASQRLASLCREHGADKREAYLLALFVEEMTTNVIVHGFQAGGNSVIVVKALFLEDRIVLNILDDCPFFDPTYYYDKIRGDEDAFSGIGIRLVVGLAKDIVYTNSFSLNNVIIEI